VKNLTLFEVGLELSVALVLLFIQLFQFELLSAEKILELRAVSLVLSLEVVSISGSDTADFWVFGVELIYVVLLLGKSILIRCSDWLIVLSFEFVEVCSTFL
jgi:hypothetical protein